VAKTRTHYTIASNVRDTFFGEKTAVFLQQKLAVASLQRKKPLAGRENVLQIEEIA
jgi:hypothetical protein